VVWTPAVKTRSQLTPEEAERTSLFHKWIVNEWDVKGDNIFIWDFYDYETGGGLYLLDENAVSFKNSHPNRDFSAKMADVLGKFLNEVINGKIE
jgi:hypothetical protein